MTSVDVVDEERDSEIQAGFEGRDFELLSQLELVLKLHILQVCVEEFEDAEVVELFELMKI